MFVQVMRFNVKPGAWPAVDELNRRWQQEQAPRAPGFKGEYVLREKAAPNRGMAVVLFENEQLAQQNSNRPETNQYYQEMLALIEGEVEFINTDEVHSYLT